MSHSESIELLLAEQIAYYRAIAMDYSVDVEAARALAAALEAYRPAGHVLELACGPGAWTELLLRSATSVTAIDAAPEMLARAKARVGVKPVRFIHADLFHWVPSQRYDFVFFGFWLSHVPPERFEPFWSMVADCLTPAGRVFFVDDSARTPQELIKGQASTTIRRRCADGSGFRLVKVPYQPAELEERLGRLGWRITVTPTSGPFYWGTGIADPSARTISPRREQCPASVS
jgi:demethylmenaquinone methyltransferase/2-methoxy-6-polyprenyl-1,4-benzoquinol methylase